MRKASAAMAIVLAAAALPAAAADVKTEIAALLIEFLAKVDDPAMHERFWADDLIYVQNSGKKLTKQEILKSMREGAQQPAPKEAEKETFAAEEVVVRQYGEAAVLNFKLVRRAAGKTDSFRNSGVFVKNAGRWQAVSWQATKVADH